MRVITNVTQKVFVCRGRVADYWGAWNRVRGVDHVIDITVYCGKSYGICSSSAVPNGRGI